MNMVKDLLKGMIIGGANVIPGVSGGTMAVVFGIYDKIIKSVTNFFKDFKKNAIFLGTLGVGAGLGIILFSLVLAGSESIGFAGLLNMYPEQTKFFFIGLIAGSIPIVYKQAAKEKGSPLNYILVVLAFMLVAAMGLMAEPTSAGKAIEALNMQNAIMLILAGFIAAATMILPGVSGSLVLLLMGLYDPIVKAVSDFNIPVLAMVAIGVLLGFLTMTKLIEALFNKYPQTAYFTILGLVAGSLVAIFPGFTFGLAGIISIVMALLGFAISFGMGKMEE